MKVQRITISIALALGMLVLFMVPLTLWQGAEEAHAQDVGAARISGITVDITPTAGLILDVNDLGDTEIRIDPTSASIVSPTTAITLYKARFELKYDVDLVRRVSLDASTAAQTFGGVVQDINDDNDGTVFFNLTFDAATPMTLTTTTVESLVDIEWQCLDVGTSVIDLVDVDLDMTDGLQSPDTATDGSVICDRPASAIGIEPEESRTFEIGEDVESTVVVTDVMDVYGIDFGVKFNNNVVEVKDVQATGLLANTNPTWEVRGDLLLFYGRASDALDGSGPIANITWKTLEAGVSQQTFDGVNTKFLDQNGQQVKKLQPSALQPETRVAGGAIIVEPAPAELYFESAALSVGAGSSTNQDVKISGVSNICEVLYRVTFDPNAVQVVDADPNLEGIQIEVGSLFSSNVNVSENVVNNVAGTIDFRVRSQSALSALTTPGQVAQITWEGLTGSTNLSFVQHSVFDCDNDNIQHEIRADSAPGSITVSGTAVTPTPTTNPNDPTSTPTPTTNPNDPTSTPTTNPNDPTATPTPTTNPNDPTSTPTPTTNPNDPTATPTTPSSGTSINGQVRVQGRASNGGATIHAGNVPCDQFTASTSNQVTTTDDTGAFSFDNNQTYLCLVIVRDGHLTAQRSNPSGDIGYIELPGGDFAPAGSTDDKIDIFDLSYAGSKFGSADSIADFNGGGDVDIFDLAIVAGNYTLSGPVNNWR
ncbi:cohesin domain-containing protein [Anaerolineales bacterium HSG24]|nr:cohesin domain-containing protein [Anaerolineales bacterium HSG24]